MAIYQSMTELIGRTPMVEFGNYRRAHKLHARIVGKLEGQNPVGSAKDRAARAMIDAAVEAGEIDKYTVVIEPTSGNMGVAIAAIAATRGNRALIVMPENMSVERQKLIRAFGAKVVLTPAELGMQGAIDKAADLAAELGNAFIPSQFTNPRNAGAHEATTGPEIWEDSEGAVDLFVAGVGTGGTVTGVGRFLKAKNPDVRVVAVEPAASPVLAGGQRGAHGIQGIGAGFVPQIYDASVVDEVLAVTDDDALQTARELASREGVLAGISSGAALAAARDLAGRPENAGKLIVALLPDTGERYLSTELFA